MNRFSLYLQLGFEHIADINGYDHFLFILSLCGIYVISQWKHVLILVTAFTIGHSLTLALATMRLVNVSSVLIEILIPVTILVTTAGNIIYKGVDFSAKLHRFKYFTALFFGLIHGLGFSNYLRELLGREANIVSPLLAFNIGLEIGQIFIVFVLLLLSLFFIKILHASRREYNLVLSGAALGVSLILIIERMNEYLNAGVLN